MAAERTSARTKVLTHAVRIAARCYSTQTGVPSRRFPLKRTWASLGSLLHYVPHPDHDTAPLPAQDRALPITPELAGRVRHRPGLLSDTPLLRVAGDRSPGRSSRPS